MTEPVETPVPDPTEPAEPGPSGSDGRLHTFSLEGRRAPGLYLVGWLGTILGGPTLFVAFASGSGGLGGLVLALGGALLLGLGLVAAAGAQAIERHDRADLAYRGPSPFLVFAASIPLSILATLPIVLLKVEPTAPAATLGSVVATDALWVFLIGLTVVGTGALRWSEIGPGIAGMPVRRIAGDVAFGALAALPVLVGTMVLTALLVGLLGVAPNGIIPVPRDGLELALDLLAAAIVAPIGEEVFYRGFATTAWTRSLGPTAAIVRGGLFFAAVHVLTIGGSQFGEAAQVAFIAFVARIPIGLALGWVFVNRRSLPASVAMHAAFNGILVVLATAAVRG